MVADIDSLAVRIAVLLREAPGCVVDIATALGRPGDVVQASMDELIRTGAAEKVSDDSGVWYRWVAVHSPAAQRASVDAALRGASPASCRHPLAV